MAIKELNHVNIRTNLMEETKDFYCDVIGLKVGWRPDFGSHGYWLYCGEQPVVHLSLSDPNGNPRTMPEGMGDGFDHIGLQANDIPGTEKQLKKAGVQYAKRLGAEGRIVQIFCLDPNGVLVELGFDSKSEGVDVATFETIDVPGMGF